LCAHLAGAIRLQRHPVPGQPNQFVFSIERTNRSTLFIFWERRALFDGEEVPPAEFSWPWPERTARARDLFGNAVSVRVSADTLQLPLTIDPTFVETEDGAATSNGPFATATTI
ncbi:MAG TPA: hypothetical protein VIM69_00295, partial [Opitutaceae bacterium]